MAVVHFLNYVTVTVCVRDVYVADSEWTLKRVKDAESEIVPVSVRSILKMRNFWLFVILSLATTGAKSIYRYLDSLYPIYMPRAPFPVADPAAVPYMTLLLLNPTLACIVTPLISVAIARWNVHPFDAILLGCSIAAGAPFLMLIVQYWAVVLFVIVLTLGEALWVPLLQKYATDFCAPGSEGIFFALSNLPLFAAKVISGSLSGILLERYCSSALDCAQGWWMWLIIGCLTASSPVLLLLSCHWTRLRR
jgi:hypothetical protein